MGQLVPGYHEVMIERYPKSSKLLRSYGEGVAQLESTS
jgi:hypothetical protein